MGSYAKEYNAAGEIGQAHRFAGVIHEVGNWEQKSVLDVGCGCGDLYPLLHAQGISGYLGIDTNEEYLAAAHQRFDDPNAGCGMFMEGTVGEGDWGLWDIVVAVEVLWTPDVRPHQFGEFIGYCWRHARETLVFTVQSSADSPYLRHEGFALSPTSMMSLCLSLSHKFKLVHHEWWETGQIAVVWR